MCNFGQNNAIMKITITSSKIKDKIKNKRLNPSTNRITLIKTTNIKNSNPMIFALIS